MRAIRSPYSTTGARDIGPQSVSARNLSKGDLANRSVVQESFQRLKPDAVMHFASNTLVPASMVHPGMYLGDNISNAVNLLDACVAAGMKHFVFSSSCAGTSHTRTVTSRIGNRRRHVERFLVCTGLTRGWLARGILDGDRFRSSCRRDIRRPCRRQR